MPDDEPVAGADDIFELNGGHVRERRTDALAFGEVGVEVEGRRVQG
jgi:hypothetical protein